MDVLLLFFFIYFRQYIMPMPAVYDVFTTYEMNTDNIYSEHPQRISRDNTIGSKYISFGLPTEFSNIYFKSHLHIS